MESRTVKIFELTPDLDNREEDVISFKIYNDFLFSIYEGTDESNCKWGFDANIEIAIKLRDFLNYALKDYDTSTTETE